MQDHSKFQMILLMMVIDPKTGQKAKFNSKNTIIENYKSKRYCN